MNENTLEAIKEIFSFFKKTTQSWGFLIILGSFPMFYASQPGVWEYLYAALSNTEAITTNHPETNIPIFLVACFVLIIGLYFAIVGTKEKQDRIIIENHEMLKLELNKTDEKRDNGLIQKLFKSLYKYETSTFVIDLLYRSRDVSGAAFYYKRGKKHVKESEVLSIDVLELKKKSKELSITYWGISFLLGILLTAGWWLPLIVIDENVQFYTYWAMSLYVVLMIPIAYVISRLKKVSSAQHLYKILKNSKLIL